jgi:hypothetical protein
MPAAPASAREVDQFRERADRFLADLDEEFYLHYAGIKEKLELEPIYERYSELTEVEKARSMGAAVNGDRGVRELWRFACEGFLGKLTREQQEREAGLEAGLKATVDGEEIPFRMLRPAISNEPDRTRRERIEAARNALVEEHLLPVQKDSVRIIRDAVSELDAPNYFELYKRFGFELEALASQCRAFLDSTERLHEQLVDKLFRDRVGIGLTEAQRWDAARVFRGTNWDAAFPKDKMLPALESTLADLGIDLRSQQNVEVDVEPRPLKDPRAFCAPIEIPGRVVLVIKPIGGPDDWRALFHEAGHTEHFAHTRAELAVEDKRLGDNAVTEGWAMLLEHLTDEPAWLTRMLDFPHPNDYAGEGAALLLYIVRRYCAKILYEIEFHSADDPTQLAPLYVEVLSDALKIEPSHTDYLSDIDSSFYVSAYLRAWAFEAQMRSFLRGEFGNSWFARREAGSLLRELWEQGQRPTADELLREVTGASIEMEAVADRVREHVG